MYTSKRHRVLNYGVVASSFSNTWTYLQMYWCNSVCIYTIYTRTRIFNYIGITKVGYLKRNRKINIWAFRGLYNLALEEKIFFSLNTALAKKLVKMSLIAICKTLAWYTLYLTPKLRACRQTFSASSSTWSVTKLLYHFRLKVIIYFFAVLEVL